MTDTISKVTVYCDDRRVGMLLRAVAGLVVGTPEVVPVINAEAKNGRIEALTGDGTVTSMFAAHIRKHKLTEVRPADAKKFLQSVGRSPLSSTYLLGQLRKAGLLKHLGKGASSTYKVVNK